VLLRALHPGQSWHSLTLYKACPSDSGTIAELGTLDTKTGIHVQQVKAASGVTIVTDSCAETGDYTPYD